MGGGPPSSGFHCALDGDGLPESQCFFGNGWLFSQLSGAVFQAEITEAHPCCSELCRPWASQQGWGPASLVMRVVVTHCLGHLALENKAVLQDFFIPWLHTIKLLIS